MRMMLVCLSLLVVVGCGYKTPLRLPATEHQEQAAQTDTTDPVLVP